MSATHDRAPPSPAASDGSSSGSSSSGAPLTPPLSTTLPMPTFMNFTSEGTINGVPTLSSVKRAPPKNNSRRVNSAERRATHNAVERARRETLNGRFLDLAAILPNLSQIRRPSKSAIVNSSIAHLNASRRHRILAAQQLRAIKEESDALRHEINQWRARAGVAGVEDPVRSDAFGVILSGELEFEQSDLLFEGSEEGDEEDYNGRHYPAAEPAAVYAEEPVDDYTLLHHQQHQMLAAQMQLQPSVHSASHHAAPSHHHPHVSSHNVYPGARMHAAPPAHYYPSPAVVDPALAATYENPAVGYEHHPYAQPTAVHADLEVQAQWAYEKSVSAHAQLYQRQRQGSW